MHYGVMPTTVFRSDHSLAQKIVAHVECSIKFNAKHDDFMSTIQILINLKARIPSHVLEPARLD